MSRPDSNAPGTEVVGDEGGPSGRPDGEVDVEAGQAAEPANGDASALARRATNKSASGASMKQMNGAGSSGSEDKAGPEEGDGEAAATPPVVEPATYGEIAKYFGILGWTAFGGPAAHIAMFQKVSWCSQTPAAAAATPG